MLFGSKKQSLKEEIKQVAFALRKAYETKRQIALHQGLRSNFSPYANDVSIRRYTYKLKDLLDYAEKKDIFSGEEKQSIDALKEWAFRYSKQKIETPKQNREDMSINKKIQELYYASAFKNNEDKNAFLRLSNIYLGNNLENKVDERLTKLEKRRITGDEEFDRSYHSNISGECKARLALLQKAYTQKVNDYYQKRAELFKSRIAKTINGQLIKWKEKHSPQINERLNSLMLAHLGRDNDYQKKFKSVEERYEQAEKILLNLGKLSYQEKKAVVKLYTIFQSYSERDLARRTYKDDSEKKRAYAKRYAHLIIHTNTLNYTLGKTPLPFK